jgi:hypothetical protein
MLLLSFSETIISQNDSAAGNLFCPQNHTRKFGAVFGARFCLLCVRNLVRHTETGTYAKRIRKCKILSKICWPKKWGNMGVMTT